MVIAQSGGPSMVINESLVGAVLAARSKRTGARIGRIYGAVHGIAGILARDYVDLRKVSEKKLMAIAATPSSALGSCRLKPTREDCRRILTTGRRFLSIMLRIHIRSLFHQKSGIWCKLRWNVEIKWLADILESLCLGAKFIVLIAEQLMDKKYGIAQVNTEG